MAKGQKPGILAFGPVYRKLIYPKLGLEVDSKDLDKPTGKTESVTQRDKRISRNKEYDRQVEELKAIARAGTEDDTVMAEILVQYKAEIAVTESEKDKAAREKAEADQKLQKLLLALGAEDIDTALAKLAPKKKTGT